MHPGMEALATFAGSVGDPPAVSPTPRTRTELCKLFVGNIDPSMTSEELKRETSQLVQNVEDAQVHVKVDENNTKTASGVITFTTWSDAIRAKATLRQSMIGGRADFALEDYREKSIREAKGLICCSITALVIVPIVLFLSLTLDQATWSRAPALADAQFDHLNATVLSSGMSYSCYWNLWGKVPPSTECVDDEKACLGVQDLLHPTSAEILAVEHVHHWRFEGCDETSRSVFSPWLKILLHDGTENKLRCAYKYGTRANTRWMRERWDGVASDFLAAHPVGSELRVWSLPTPEHCLVGVSNPADMASTGTSRTSWFLAVLALVLLTSSLCILLGKKGHARALRIPAEPDML